MLKDHPSPVQSLAVVIWMGDFTGSPGIPDASRDWYAKALPQAIEKRLPEIFQVNGISIKKIIVSNAKQRANSWPNIDTNFGDVSHIFVLASAGYVSRNGVASFIFDAYLWDARSKTPIMKAVPEVGVVVNQPLLRAQLLAGELLNGMGQNKLIELKTGSAIDLAGEPITNGYYVGARDR